MGKNVLGAKEKFAIAGLLREHTERIDDDHVRYTDGWSDQRIADQIGGIITWKHVARFRQDALGNLPHVSGPATKVQERLAQAELTIELLISRFNLLAIATGNPDLGIKPEDRP